MNGPEEFRMTPELLVAAGRLAEALSQMSQALMHRDDPQSVKSRTEFNKQLYWISYHIGWTLSREANEYKKRFPDPKTNAPNEPLFESQPPKPGPQYGTNYSGGYQGKKPGAFHDYHNPDDAPF